MAGAREIRRLAFQALFQLDAQGGQGPAQIRAWLDEPENGESLSAGERDTAFQTALAAYTDRALTDAAILALAPTWPAYRQAAVDRAILRLACHEMRRAAVPPKVVVNEAVELAKEFSTEKSPSFINAVLDKVLKRTLAAAAAATPPAETADAPPPA